MRLRQVSEKGRRKERVWLGGWACARARVLGIGKGVGLYVRSVVVRVVEEIDTYALQTHP